MKKSTIRIVSWGGIGDALLTTPLFRAIKEQSPSSRLIVYALSYGHYEIFLNNPYIDKLKKSSRLAKLAVLIVYRLKLLKLFVPIY